MSVCLNEKLKLQSMFPILIYVLNNWELLMRKFRALVVLFCCRQRRKRMSKLSSLRRFFASNRNCLSWAARGITQKRSSRSLGKRAAEVKKERKMRVSVFIRFAHSFTWWKNSLVFVYVDSHQCEKRMYLF
jgi:hypothetical protein